MLFYSFIYLIYLLLFYIFISSMFPLLLCFVILNKPFITFDHEILLSLLRNNVVLRSFWNKLFLCSHSHLDISRCIGRSISEIMIAFGHPSIYGVMCFILIADKCHYHPLETAQ